MALAAHTQQTVISSLRLFRTMAINLLKPVLKMVRYYTKRGGIIEVNKYMWKVKIYPNLQPQLQLLVMKL